MKNWDSSDLVKVILAFTIPLSITEILVIRAITGQPVSEQGIGLIKEVIIGILVAVTAIEAAKTINKKNDLL